MTRLLVRFVLLLAAPFVLTALFDTLGAQSVTRRDSAVADTLVRIRPNVQTGRDRAKIDSLVRVLRTVVAPVTPPAPAASFTVRCDTTGTFRCAFDGRASTGARLTYAWTCGAVPECAPGSVATFSFAYPHEGPRTAILTVRDSLGRAASMTRSFTVVAPVVEPPPPPDSTPTTPPDTGATPPPPPPPPPDSGAGPVIATPPALPLTVPGFSLPPAPLRYVSIAAGGNLQAALDTAKAGDEIRLANGATYTGNFVLPAKACTGWVTLRSTTVVTPGARATPAAAVGYAKLVTPNNQPALRTAIPTCQWRVVGVEITGTLAVTSVQYGLVTLGDGGWVGGGEKQTSLSLVPQQLVLDRVYIHGTPTLNTVRCLALNSGPTQVINSWLSDCHAKGFDSQAIEGWNGPGPYLIENNFLGGAGENVMFGGADPGIPGLIPSDITIRRNHVAKDPAWKGLWAVKNLFELKNARRVLVEANVFENNWADGQSGMAIVVKSTTDVCGTGCMWEGSTDVTFRYNIVRNSPRGLNVQAYDNSYVPTGTNNHVARVRAEHNLFYNIGTFNGTGADGWLMLLTHDLSDVAVVHNTFLGNLPGAGLAGEFAYSQGLARRIAIDDNVFGALGYYAFHSDAGLHRQALESFAPGSWSFQRNAVAQVWAEYWPLNPSTSWYRATVAELGLAADRSLAAASPFKGKGYNGTDPGANVAEVLRQTAGVVVP